MDAVCVCVCVCVCVMFTGNIRAESENVCVWVWRNVFLMYLSCPHSVQDTDECVFKCSSCCTSYFFLPFMPPPPPPLSSSPLLLPSPPHCFYVSVTLWNMFAVSDVLYITGSILLVHGCAHFLILTNDWSAVSHHLFFLSTIKARVHLRFIPDRYAGWNIQAPKKSRQISCTLSF